MQDCIPTKHGQIGLLHGDLHHRNVIESPGQQLVAIDWINMRHGPLVDDLGTAILWVSRADRFSMESVERLFVAYGEIFPLDPERRDEALASGYRKSLEFYAWQLLESYRGQTTQSRLESARQSVEAMRLLQCAP